MKSTELAFLAMLTTVCPFMSSVSSHPSPQCTPTTTEGSSGKKFGFGNFIQLKYLFVHLSPCIWNRVESSSGFIRIPFGSIGWTRTPKEDSVVNHKVTRFFLFFCSSCESLEQTPNQSRILPTDLINMFSWSTPRLFSIALLWILIFYQADPLQSDETSGKEHHPDEDYDSQTLEPLPYFDRNATIITNITVQMGTDVFLSCRVNRLGDKVVSWMKKDDKGIPKLLTYGLITYSSDSRQSPHFEKPNNWQLRLNAVQRTDAGSYQCQMSTHPPKILHFSLNVVAPTVEIVDDGEKPLKDKIFKTGSTLELRCIVGQVGPGIVQHVSWYHGSRLLNNDTYRGGISVKSWVRKDFGLSKLSKLYVANVNKSDSGLYTCSLGRYGNATVFVSVLNGETPAAMQHGQASHPIPVSLLILIFGFLIFASSNFV
ncbi:unnamed protein product [Allacma fusca]|uniref:Ig-like domain-containing protein n=1 Tax=Allacma fusca TaxID=39272 RepID=A0A8J2LLI7_9HEXA|nr:unnamed protein product [Allacma fusca]